MADRPDPGMAGDVVTAADGREPFRVYARRWFILAGYSLTMFGWNLSGGRHLPITSAYARHFNTTNEIQGIKEFGVDAIPISTSITLLFTYFLGAYLVDRFGLNMLTIGSGSVCFSNWMWYFADTSLLVVLISRVVGALLGGAVPASLMAVSNRWFGERERSTATAIGSLCALIGSGGALIVSPFFATQSDQVVDLTLKSCQRDLVPRFIVELYDAAQTNGTELLCIDAVRDAQDHFCCYLPVDIAALNLTMAVVPTLSFLFTLCVVRALPPTPPSPAAEKKDYPSVFKALSLLYRTERFIKISVSDLVVSGPPAVLVASISRIFPGKVADYSFVASAAGLLLGIPASLIVARFLGRTKAYWTFSMVGYATGTTLWILATIAFAVGSTVAYYVMSVLVVLSIVAFISWQTSIYELKLEYVFRNDVALEGWVVGTDRIVINLSAIIFVALIPPERVGGGLYTFIYGSFIMAAGCLPTALIRQKYRYKRNKFEMDATLSKRAETLAEVNAPLTKPSVPPSGAEGSITQT
mmetsp:Transcript_10114/g.17804  ORF Transcript_10114/g.17804 Transcript_10114/m.17804 type:complete len:527 (+) Transcript_10114:114-1694(+)